jgi:hypothetical protein
MGNRVLVVRWRAQLTEDAPVKLAAGYAALLELRTRQLGQLLVQSGRRPRVGPVIENLEVSGNKASNPVEGLPNRPADWRFRRLHVPLI